MSKPIDRLEQWEAEQAEDEAAAKRQRRDNNDIRPGDYSLAGLDPQAAGHDYSDTGPIEYQQRELAVRLRALPFAGLVLNHDLPDPYKTDELFMAATIDWLNEYRGVVQAQSDEFTKQARTVGRLLDERDAVRAFFGLSDDRDPLRQCPVCGLIDAHASQCRRA